jgi:type I restriction enzyme, S subunit
MTNWQKVKISQFLKERVGSFDPSDEAVKRLKRLDKIDFSGEIHLSEKASKTDMILIMPGDLVISGINVAKGALAVYHGNEPITATIHYSSYRFDEKHININYFKRFVKSQSFVQALKDQVKGGIKTEIKPKNFLPLEIQMPDIDSQTKIVSFFQRIENEMGALDQEIDKQAYFFKHLRQQILQEAIEGKLTEQWRKQNPELISGDNHASKLFEKIKTEKAQMIKEGKIEKEKPFTPITEEEKPFNIPEGWVWCRLGDIAFGFDYGSSTKSQKIGKVPVLRMGNLQNGTINWKDLVYTNDEKEISKYLLRSNDLLFNRTNSRELVGKTGLYNFTQKAIYAGYIIRFHMYGNFNPRFSNYIMNSTFHRKWCDAVKTDAIGQSNINATKLREYLFPLPPLIEQDAIVARVDKIIAMINKLELQVSERKDLSDKLMQAVLREAFDANG